MAPSQRNSTSTWPLFDLLKRFTDAHDLASPPPSYTGTHFGVLPTRDARQANTTTHNPAEHASSPQLPPHETRKTWKWALGLNPGFCPGAVTLRANNAKWWKFDDPCKCCYCGLIPQNAYLDSYTKDCDYPTYHAEFAMACHIEARPRDGRDMRSCIVCWEQRGLWVHIALS
jgi:hypothetical protein